MFYLEKNKKFRQNRLISIAFIYLYSLDWFRSMQVRAGPLPYLAVEAEARSPFRPFSVSVEAQTDTENELNKK